MRVIGQENLCRLMRRIPPTAALFSHRYRDPLRYHLLSRCVPTESSSARQHKTFDFKSIFHVPTTSSLSICTRAGIFLGKVSLLLIRKRRMSNVDSSADFSSGEHPWTLSRARENFCSRCEVILRNNLHHNFPNCNGILNCIGKLNYLFKQRKSSISFPFTFPEFNDSENFFHPLRFPSFPPFVLILWFYASAWKVE